MRQNSVNCIGGYERIFKVLNCCRQWFCSRVGEISEKVQNCNSVVIVGFVNESNDPEKGAKKDALILD